MKTKYIVWVMAAAIMLGCATVNNFLATETPIPTNTPNPTNTPTPASTSTPPATHTPTPEPTIDPLAVILGTRQLVGDFSFSFKVPLAYDAEVSGSQVTIGDDNFYTIISLISLQRQDDLSIEETLQGFLDNVAGDPDTEDFEAGEFYDASIDGRDAVAADVSGKLFGDAFVGRVLVAETEDSLIFVGFGLAVDQFEPGDRWENEGQFAFNAVINSIDFDLGEQQTGDCLISDDDSYGYSEDNPIRVGGDSFEGPARARFFLDNLLGPDGEAVSYERTASLPTADTILDTYAVEIAGGETVLLYVDQYSYTEPLAPVGFTCFGAFPLSAP